MEQTKETLEKNDGSDNCKNCFNSVSEKFEVFPYDTQKLKEKQMVIEYGKYERDNGLLGEQWSEVFKWKNLLKSTYIKIATA